MDGCRAVDHNASRVHPTSLLLLRPFALPLELVQAPRRLQVDQRGPTGSAWPPRLHSRSGRVHRDRAVRRTLLTAGLATGPEQESRHAEALDEAKVQGCACGPPAQGSPVLILPHSQSIAGCCLRTTATVPDDGHHEPLPRSHGRASTGSERRLGWCPSRRPIPVARAERGPSSSARRRRLACAPGTAPCDE